MLPGFNEDVQFDEKRYHVQTEDSGVANPHIITHVFVGGNILATRKTSYARLVKAPDLQLLVAQLMEKQHKALISELKGGALLAAKQPEAQRPAGAVVQSSKQQAAPAPRPQVAAPRVETPPPPPKAAPIVPASQPSSEKSLDDIILAYFGGEAPKK